MTKDKLIAALQDDGSPGDTEVVVRLSVPEDAFEGTSASELDGEYAFITDDRSMVGVEYGRLVIIGDLQP
jgi:hypothetical protein